MPKQYYIYILTNKSRTLDVGVTGDLVRRIDEHRRKVFSGFTQWYNITMLVYYEATADVHAALAREKQIKAWRRSKKIALTEAANPNWLDLTTEGP